MLQCSKLRMSNLNNFLIFSILTLGPRASGSGPPKYPKKHIKIFAPQAKIFCMGTSQTMVSGPQPLVEVRAQTALTGSIQNTSPRVHVFLCIFANIWLQKTWTRSLEPSRRELLKNEVKFGSHMHLVFYFFKLLGHVVYTCCDFILKNTQLQKTWTRSLEPSRRDLLKNTIKSGTKG